ncbi:hypothetical protein ABW19_dt0204900 [Dactylella cylindrospora]|nr:hypothetical protein ABW19_dt0204900 [Dactylella cylindrospora]
MSAPAALASECLYSIPINQENALEQLAGIQRYLQFQSTLEYIKNPPSEDISQSPQGIDIVAGIHELAYQVRTNVITQEYDFELKLYTLFAGANDGHLTALLGALLPIRFSAPLIIVSVSRDGIALPEVFQARRGPSGQLQAVGSAIKSIDGKGVIEYLQRVTPVIGFQSPDARYNSLFPVRGVGGQLMEPGFFQDRRIYPGKNGFTIQFANGTSSEYEYIAEIHGDFRNVTDPASFYDIFVKGGQLIERPQKVKCADKKERNFNHIQAYFSQPEKSWGVSRRSEFPEAGVKPVVQDRAGIFAGYFLRKTNTAVLQMFGFDPPCASDIVSTMTSISIFLKKCREKGATKLIVDLTGNTGGYVTLGYDLFMQLFPRVVPYNGHRLRINPASLIKARAFSNVTYGGLSNILKRNGSSLAFAISGSDWLHSLNFDENYAPFSSSEQFVGHEKARVGGDEYSAIWRFNITGSPFGLRNRNYSSKLNEKPLFDPQNIVLLSDGLCSSTCSSFAEIMQTQMNVKSISIGGLPFQGRGMALVGGVRGCRTVSYKNLLEAAEAVSNIAPTSDPEELNNRRQHLPQKLPLPMIGTVNYFDNIRKGETTPLQFVEEPTTCRMWYTKKTLSDIEALWEAVDDAAFGSGQGCVVGQLKKVDSTE